MTAPAPDLKRNVSPPVGQRNLRLLRRHRSRDPAGHLQPRGLSRHRLSASATTRSSSASLHAALSSSRHPAPLAGLRTRDDDDFTIGLIDAFACAADVLTFYQERIANESYLRTATERVSLQEMGKLIGYRLRPGVAAETWLAFALETRPVAARQSAAGARQFRHRHAGQPAARRGPQGAERAGPRREAADLRDSSKRSTKRGPNGTRSGPG